MRRAFRLVALLLALAALTVGCQSYRLGQGPALLPPEPQALRIATHNVHYIIMGRDEGRWSEGGWHLRKPAFQATFAALNADIVAYQEMESFARGSGNPTNLALSFLLENNPEYGAAAQGDPARFPSTQPILYRKSRLTALDQGWFFFSETPDTIYSRTFNGSYPAFASWARFRTKGGATFRVLNVHLDAFSRSNRRRSAALITERMAPWLDRGEPLFLVGDTNELASSALMETLTAPGLSLLKTPGATYHFDRGINLFGAIDHIAHSPGPQPLGAPVVYRQKFGTHWPSDHYPVAADFRL